MGNFQDGCDACGADVDDELLTEAETGREICAECNAAETVAHCAFCSKPHEGQFSIHRDGFCEGPQVPLCNACGGKSEPSEAQIWERISQAPELVERRRMAN